MAEAKIELSEVQLKVRKLEEKVPTLQAEHARLSGVVSDPPASVCSLQSCDAAFIECPGDAVSAILSQFCAILVSAHAAITQFQGEDSIMPIDLPTLKCSSSSTIVAFY